MRFYFLSRKPAALKADGKFLGRADSFERYIELNHSETPFIELLPEGGCVPLSFFLDEKLLNAPPPFLNVYRSNSCALLQVKRYYYADARINVIFQRRFSSCLVTLYSQGENFLSVEGGEFFLTPLGEKFSRAEAIERTLNGFPVLEIKDGRDIIILSSSGKTLFFNGVEKIEYEQTLKAELPFESSAGFVGILEYSYDGNNLKAESARLKKTHPDAAVMHFDFFESVMLGADVESFLCEELKPKKGDLGEYLGDFVGVLVPFEEIEKKAGGDFAAGLIYREGENLFKIKFFAVRTRDGKVENVYEIEG